MSVWTALLLVACCACSGGGAPDPAETGVTVDDLSTGDAVDAEVDDGPLVVGVGVIDVDDAEIGGELGLMGPTGDCVGFVDQGIGVLWPERTRWDSSTDEILTQGVRLRLGDNVVGRGSVKEVPDEIADWHWRIGLTEQALAVMQSCGWAEFAGGDGFEVAPPGDN